MFTKAYKNLTQDQWLDLRKTVVTSTSMSAILGLSTYKTRFEYWHERKGLYTENFEETERIKWGRKLESVIGYGIAEEQGWTVEPFKDFLVNEELNAGSSFDFKITDNPERPAETGILEVKNVDGLQFYGYQSKWEVDSDVIISAPPYIEIQIMFQLFISGLDYIYCGILVGGNKAYTLLREPDQELFSMFEDEIISFNSELSLDIPPKPDWEADADLIIQLNQSVSAMTTMDCTGMYKIESAAETYIAASQSEKLASTEKKTCKAIILSEIGDYEKATNENFTITAKKNAKGSRVLRITPKGRLK